MKKWLMAVVFGTLLVLGACGGGGDDTSEPAEDNDESTEEGTEKGATVENAAAEELYEQSCASCHGDDLSGQVGPALDTIGSDMSSDEILTVIEDGQGSMPPGLLSGDDAQEVADWLAEHK